MNSFEGYESWTMLKSKEGVTVEVEKNYDPNGHPQTITRIDYASRTKALAAHKDVRWHPPDYDMNSIVLAFAQAWNGKFC